MKTKSTALLILLYTVLAGINLYAQEDDRGYIVEVGQMAPDFIVTTTDGKMKVTYPLAPDPGANVFALYALKESGVTRNIIIDMEGKIAFLTKLYEEKEFNEMKEKIKELVIFN